MQLIILLSLLSNNAMDSVGMIKENGKSYILHQINKGQTLSNISKTYHVPIKDIITVNNIDAEKIQAGQKIKIPVVRELNNNTTSEVSTNSRSNTVMIDKTSESTKKTTTSTKPTTTLKPGSTSIAPSKDIKLKPTTSKGLVGLGSSDYLDPISKIALHPTLPNGSIVKVVNPNNGRLVFVRIVGKPTSEFGIFDLVISQSAMDQLKVIGEKVQADLTFGIAE